MTASYKINNAQLGLGSICEPILRSLPDWFGIEEAIQRYVADIDHLPTYTAQLGNQVVGFFTIKKHHPASAELYVLGILSEHHGQGIGKALLKAIEDDLRQQGVRFLQVKTIDPQANNNHYRRTFDFYRSVGFAELETFPELWGTHNPCLQMVKAL